MEYTVSMNKAENLKTGTIHYVVDGKVRCTQKPVSKAYAILTAEEAAQWSVTCSKCDGTRVYGRR